MSTEPSRAEYVTRDAILKLLSDEENQRVSMREAGLPLTDGEEYVDLDYPYQGVQRARASIELPMGQLLPRAAVSDGTWTKILLRVDEGILADAPTERNAR